MRSSYSETETSYTSSTISVMDERKVAPPALTFLVVGLMCNFGGLSGFTTAVFSIGSSYLVYRFVERKERNS